MKQLDIMWRSTQKQNFQKGILTSEKIRAMKRHAYQPQQPPPPPPKKKEKKIKVLLNQAIMAAYMNRID